jgi:hypothetical protein
MFFFFLEHASELHIIILRRKKGYEPLQNPHTFTPADLHKHARLYKQRSGPDLCSMLVRHWGEEMSNPSSPSHTPRVQLLTSQQQGSSYVWGCTIKHTLIAVNKKCSVGNYANKKVCGSRCVCCVPFSFGEWVPLVLKIASRFLK